MPDAGGLPGTSGEEVHMTEAQGRPQEFLGALFGAQRLAVLSTHSAEQPYASLVAFVTSKDLKHLFFATDRATRKFSNLVENPPVAILIDNRSNREADFKEASAVTALGKARELAGDEKSGWLEAYIARHPHLAAFAKSPTSALVQVNVEKYILVSGFQEVTEFQP
jgi:nitroimidazol reductase NimA-like FMN-containing flavoprotein (pyridoxamine 5'-phosphate oxidase superfamily)